MKTGQPIHIDESLNPSKISADGNSNPRNTSAWTPEEDQILFDGLLIGNIPHLWHRLDKDFGRTEEDVDSRIQHLMPALLPQCWCLSREAAYKLVREWKHDGEPALSKPEWKEIVLWIHNDYVGINPSIFDWTRSTERLRQEVRIFDDLHFSIFDRVAKMFVAERDSNAGKPLAKGKRYKPIGPHSAEAKERRSKKDAETKERREKEKAEIKEGRKKEKAEIKEGRKKKKGENKKTGSEQNPGLQPRTNNDATGKMKRDPSDETNDERAEEDTRTY